MTWPGTRKRAIHPWKTVRAVGLAWIMALGLLIGGVAADWIPGKAQAAPSDWIAAMCADARFTKDPNASFPRYAESSGRCDLLGPESVDDNVTMFLGLYSSAADRDKEIADFGRLMFPVLAYATKDSADGSLWLAFAQAYTETPAQLAHSVSDSYIARLGQFGFSVRA
ncbi:hypothetical protein [Mycolicibacterium sp. YH-1]|uniref:hypothetical protein n=1 Tax=Mycolicibacterium sp. YH-1 TaxID=2908837 RepID=UPI001F4BF134|nr:hypothetical protein [Mycolicibacterium sp. YH-1]UNB52871.1 hypothetical protein L0M16_00325 [Mycolicibacterium sp. YH-1]